MSSAISENLDPGLPPVATPGLTHNRFLTWLDRTGLPSWLIGIACYFTLTVIAIMVLILVRVPDPAYYRNSVAFTAIVSFLFGLYFTMGRGWHQDLVKILGFDPELQERLSSLEPSRLIVAVELLLAATSALVNVQISVAGASADLAVLKLVLAMFYFLQYAAAIFCIDVLVRQISSLWQVTRHIRIDLWEMQFYSTLANPMQRFFGLYVFGLCVITMSFLVFTEGTYGAGQMMIIMMPWYLPGLLFMSVYMIPYGTFRRRVALLKSLELNRIAEALKGNRSLLAASLVAEDAPSLRLVDLLSYQDRIGRVREWPFTDRIRALVLFGILPPLTWVLAALIEIVIESTL